MSVAMRVTSLPQWSRRNSSDQWVSDVYDNTNILHERQIFAFDLSFEYIFPIVKIFMYFGWKNQCLFRVEARGKKLPCVT